MPDVLPATQTTVSKHRKTQKALTLMSVAGFQPFFIHHETFTERAMHPLRGCQPTENIKLLQQMITSKHTNILFYQQFFNLGEKV